MSAITLSPTQVDALRKVIDYLAEEEFDYQVFTEHGGKPEQHIHFHALALQAALNDLPKDSNADETKPSLQVVWEQLNGALYDLTEGTPSDATSAIEDCIARVESIINP